MSHEERLAKLKRMLAARTRGGEAMKEYRDSVPAIRAEIARLEALGGNDAA